jgi:hypothetical protein
MIIRKLDCTLGMRDILCYSLLFKGNYLFILIEQFVNEKEESLRL